ncbi:MAG: tRNA preQ1(34) S-adenosylmethionine ribosyltransferase-isomerase QueA [Firmicutes bacterium]|nr:tRNA preQ1(34) S-adenosylmethionine ribosyltransferase-isomerase QueA [Candidatus Colivicinus equi]
MKLEEFDYYLPEELIAQHPTDIRDQSRLLVLHKNTGEIEHRHFYDIIDYLHEGDVIVRNNSRVIPARIYGVKRDTGAKVEAVILKIKDDICECLCGNAKPIKVGSIIDFSDKLYAECIEVKDEGVRMLKMHYEGIFMEILDEIGNMPTPPYIHEKLTNKSRYNNVYAQVDGSAACPTAGLHFTEELIEKIKAKGVEFLDITLHVGLGTFKPVKEENVEDHNMHYEFYSMSQEVADKLNTAKKQGRRIIGVGTTSTRTLETVMNLYGEFRGCSGETNIFIYPPYEFKAIDCQVTNFHLPKSTLIMMISALTSKQMILDTYKVAVEEKYRFFSFGDAMFITNE